MSELLSFLTYERLIILELVLLHDVVLTLLLRKPEVITTKSGNTVVRPKNRTPLICVLLLLAVTWALHMKIGRAHV